LFSSALSNETYGCLPYQATDNRADNNEEIKKRLAAKQKLFEEQQVSNKLTWAFLNTLECED